MQEVKLWEASKHGLVNKIPDLLKCVNVNLAKLVSNTNAVKSKGFISYAGIKKVSFFSQCSCTASEDFI